MTKSLTKNQKTALIILLIAAFILYSPKITIGDEAKQLENKLGSPSFIEEPSLQRCQQTASGQQDLFCSDCYSIKRAGQVETTFRSTCTTKSKPTLEEAKTLDCKALGTCNNITTKPSIFDPLKKAIAGIVDSTVGAIAPALIASLNVGEKVSMFLGIILAGISIVAFITAGSVISLPIVGLLILSGFFFTSAGLFGISSNIVSGTPQSGVLQLSSNQINSCIQASSTMEVNTQLSYCKNILCSTYNSDLKVDCESKVASALLDASIKNALKPKGE